MGESVAVDDDGNIYMGIERHQGVERYAGANPPSIKEARPSTFGSNCARCDCHQRRLLPG